MLAMITVAAFAVQSVPSAAATLTVEVFGNSVMRGTPHCITVLPNGFNESLASVCPSVAPHGESGVASVRVTGTLTADADGWHRFVAQVDQLTWIRLWVDVRCRRPVIGPRKSSHLCHFTVHPHVQSRVPTLNSTGNNIFACRWNTVRAIGQYKIKCHTLKQCTHIPSHRRSARHIYTSFTLRLTDASCVCMNRWRIAGSPTRRPVGATQGCISLDPRTPSQRLSLCRPTGVCPRGHAAMERSPCVSSRLDLNPRWHACGGVTFSTVPHCVGATATEAHSAREGRHGMESVGPQQQFGAGCAPTASRR